eukprot:SAG31_NODE_12_length_38498_cov_21.161671_11_plen_191_part_00
MAITPTRDHAHRAAHAWPIGCHHHESQSCSLREARRAPLDSFSLQPLQQPPMLLQFAEMPFNSKRVDVTKGTDPQQFVADLRESLGVWRADGTTAVWIRCPADAADCIVPAAALGFTFHNAEGGVAMLSLWLDTSSENKIPTFATRAPQKHTAVAPTAVASVNMLRHQISIMMQHDLVRPQTQLASADSC